MKHLVLLFAILLLVSCSSSSKKPADIAPIKVKNGTAQKSAVQRGNVYICTGGSSKRYHCDRDCKGLSRCSGEIEEVSEEEAEDMGRTPCKICY